MKNIILFTDLDDTLFHSHHKKPPQADSIALAFLADGSPISYADRKQQDWLAHWQQHSSIIPVTARNLDSYRRVNIPFAHHAIINYGGIILLPDGSIDQAWFARSQAAAQTSTARLEQLAACTHDLAKDILQDLNIRIISDLGINFYLLIKSRSHNQATLEQAAALLKPALLAEEKLHLNANNLAILPAWLDKSYAVEHLLAQYRQENPHCIAIGMGDSLIDLAFMRCCDYFISPTDSQISAATAKI